MKSLKTSQRYATIIITSIFLVLVTCTKKEEVKLEVEVFTGLIKDISYTTCTVGGTIGDVGEGIKQHGFCWSESSNPSINNNKVELGVKSTTGAFSGDLTNLTQNTTYYVRAYAKSNDPVVYGEAKSFTTKSHELPTVTTSLVTSITSNSAESGGNVTEDGGTEVTARGVCWGTSENPTISDSKTINGSGLGSYNSSITGLLGAKPYYVRAYATNSMGTAYGNNQPFTTLILLVSSISVSGEGGATSIITYNGALQMIATVSPSDATDKSVSWSVIPGTGDATINSNGLLKAVSSGTVTVRATANDGSGVQGVIQISIPNPPDLIAIIYKDNSTDANSFKTLLIGNGADVNLIEIDDVASTSFSNYNLIIITSNTSYGSEWGTAQAVNNIKNSGKLVLGLGAGGAGFFEEYGLSINWGNSWYGASSTSSQNTSIFCTFTTHQVFKNPTSISIPTNKIIQLYSESGHVGEYAPSLNQSVLLIGREPTNTTHYSIVSENSHWLWGFTNSPNYMTQAGKNLFLNIVFYMLD